MGISGNVDADKTLKAIKLVAGAWLELDWPIPYEVNRVILYDRPNDTDQILAATLIFNDGSTLETGPLANNGGATEYTFPPKVITSLRMNVNQVSGSTENTGLAEIEIYGYPNIAPLAAITASSETPASDQLAVKAIEGCFYKATRRVEATYTVCQYGCQETEYSSPGTLNIYKMHLPPLLVHCKTNSLHPFRASL